MIQVMNATAQASVASISGPKLDNRRVLAALVDLAIVVAGTLVILVAADAIGDRSELQGALGAVVVGWALYYHFALESGDGQTVGKKLMKLRVVRADGRPAEMRDIAVRTVLRVVDGIGGYIVGLIVMLATGQRRQRLGDLAAGTIVVDASAPAFVPPAPAVEAEPVDQPVEDEQPEGESIEDQPVENRSTITLPTRQAPATLADLAGPEAPPVPEMRPFDPPVGDEVDDEPIDDEPHVPLAVVEVDEPAEEERVEDEPAVPVALVEAVALAEDEPVEEEPAVALVEDEPVDDDSLAEISTPSLQELARDVDAARTEPLSVVEPLEDEPADQPDEEPAEEPFTLRSVETVSAIDLVMGGASEDDSSDDDYAPEPPRAS
jgi:uncharacterized RDD family membrane protein YckC